MLVLVRHGRTAWNAQRRFVGRTDVELDERGEDQARTAGAVLGEVEVLVTSPLVRARRTAELLGTGLAPVVTDAFIELDYGELEGTLVAEVPVATWRAWREDPAAPIAGGESLAQVHDRVAAALSELFADPGGPARSEGRTVVVVSHVSPIKAAVAWVLGLGPESATKMRLDNGSLTTIGWGAAGAVLVAYNVVPN